MNLKSVKTAELLYKRGGKQSEGKNFRKGIILSVLLLLLSIVLSTKALQ